MIGSRIGTDIAVVVVAVILACGFAGMMWEATERARRARAYKRADRARRSQ